VSQRTRIVFGGVLRRLLTGADVTKACWGPLPAANEVQPTDVVVLYINKTEYGTPSKEMQKMKCKDIVYDIHTL
jgi:hypothetical protein